MLTDLKVDKYKRKTSCLTVYSSRFPQAASLTDPGACFSSFFAVKAAEKRVTGLESVLGGYSDSLTTLEKEFSIVKKELALLRDRSEDLEERSRLSNLHITGVKEGREHGRRVTEYVASILKDTLNIEKTPILDRTHRTLHSKPVDDKELSRAFMIECHYFSEKEDILEKAIEMKEITTVNWAVKDNTNVNVTLRLAFK